MSYRIFKSFIILCLIGTSSLIAEKCFTISERGSDAYLISIKSGGYSFQSKSDRFGTYTEIITSDEFNHSSGIGKPLLPNIPFTLQGKYTYEIISAEYDTINNITIRPGNRPMMIGPDFYDSLEELTFSSLYTKDIFWPSNGVISEKYGVFKEIPVTSFKATPFAYNPLTKTLLCAKEMKILCKRVETEGNFRAPENMSPLVASILPKDVQRDVSKRSFIEENGRAGKIVVFTIDSLLPAVKKLVRWQRLKGYDVVLESRAERYTKSDVIATIDKELTQSDATSKYILILGNTRMVEEFEVRWRYFNTIGNLQGVSCSRYGDTHGDDHLPEIARGVVPANNLKEAMICVDKFISYETDPVREPSFYNNILAAAQQGFSHKGVNHIMDYMDEKGYTTAPRLYYAEDSTGVIDRINDGVIIAAQYDHGYRGGWATPKFTGNEINVLENGNKLPYMLSINCLSGSWDYANGMDKWNPKATYEPGFYGLTERFLFKENGGGVGALGASNITYTGFNDYLLFGIFYALWPKENNRTPIYRTGDILDYGLFYMHECKGITDIEYGDEYGDEEMCDYHFMLYHNMCDPTLQIRTKAPTMVTATYELKLGEHETAYTISDVNLSEATAVLYNEKSGTVIGRTKIIAGKGTILITPDTYIKGDSITLSINGDNCVPLISSFICGGVSAIKESSKVHASTITLGNRFLHIANHHDNSGRYTIYTLQGKVIQSGLIPAKGQLNISKRDLQLGRGSYILSVTVADRVSCHKFMQ